MWKFCDFFQHNQLRLRSTDLLLETVFLWGRLHMNSLFYEKTIKDRIRKKLVETEATSLQKAVTIIEAKFDDEEQNWLICIRRRTIFSSEENKRQTILYRRLTVYDRTLSDFEPLSSIKRNLD